jgi:hypothetical protein
MERWCALSVRKCGYEGEQSVLARQCIPLMLFHLFKKQLRGLSVVQIKDYPLHAFASCSMLPSHNPTLARS